MSEKWRKKISSQRKSFRKTTLRRGEFKKKKRELETGKYREGGGSEKKENQEREGAPFGELQAKKKE